jgi:transposase
MLNLRYAGMDVHKDSIVIATARSDGALPEVLERLEYSPSRVLARLKKLGPLSQLQVCYEAGPTGYGLQRYLQAAGVDCVVVAPALLPQARGRVKTDRRDACHLARLLRSGDVTRIETPDEQTEAVRDLVRARDAARRAERRIRQQLLKFLLRHDRRYTLGKEHWTKTHWNWIRGLKFTQEAQQRVLADAIQTAGEAEARLQRLDEDLAASLEGWRLAPLVRHLQAFRGVKLLTATGVAAEVIDFRRFPRADKFMGFVGLVPSEYSTGTTRRQGGITKAGNGHVRRLLIEAAWHYYAAPLTISPAMAKRREGVPAEVVAIADQALRRLRKKSRDMQRKGKSASTIVTALARELAGFVWAAARATGDAADPVTQATPRRTASGFRRMTAGAAR